MSLSVDVALDHACTRLNRVTLQPFFVDSLRAHTFSDRASTRTMFQIEVVVTEECDKTISLWFWHSDTVRCVKRLIEERHYIPEEEQRLIFPGRGILEDDLDITVVMSPLCTSPDTPPPRLFLFGNDEPDQDEAAEGPGEWWWHQWLASVGDVPVAAGASSAVSECGSSVDMSAAEDALQFEHSRFSPPPQQWELSPPPQQWEVGAIDGAWTHWHEMPAGRVVGRPGLAHTAKNGEVRYVFDYRSTGDSLTTKSVLILVRTGSAEKLCEFWTCGHIAEPHGAWLVEHDSTKLQVWFNDHFCDEPPESWKIPESPTTFYKVPGNPNHWQAADDDGEIIDLVWVRSTHFCDGWETVSERL